MFFHSFMELIIYLAAGSIAMFSCFRFFIEILRSCSKSPEADQEPDDGFVARDEWKDFLKVKENDKR